MKVFSFWSIGLALYPFLFASHSFAESPSLSADLNALAKKIQTQLASAHSSPPVLTRLCGDEHLAPPLVAVINNQMEVWRLKDADIEGEFALLVYSYHNLTPAGLPWHLSPHFRHYIFAWISRPGQAHEVHPVFATNDTVLFPRISSAGHVSFTTLSQNSEMNLFACQAFSLGQAPTIATFYPCVMDVYTPQNQTILTQANYPSQFTLSNVQWIHDWLYYSTWTSSGPNQVDSQVMEWNFSTSSATSIFTYQHSTNKFELFDVDFTGRLSFREHMAASNSVPTLGNVIYHSGMALAPPSPHYSEINPNNSYFTARTYDVFNEVHSFIATPESVAGPTPSFGTHLSYISSATQFNTASAVPLGLQGDGYKVGNAKMGWDNTAGLHRLVVDEYVNANDGKLSVYEKSPLGQYVLRGDIRDPSGNRMILKKVSGDRILVQRPWDYSYTHAVYYCD